MLEVVTRYAIHNGDRGVGFTVKRAGEATADLHTPSGAGTAAGSASTLGAIRVAYGNSLAKELLPFACSSGADEAPGASSSDLTGQATEQGSAAAGGASAAESYSFTAKGFVSNANYSAKKPAFILFINDRLVEVNG